MIWRADSTWDRACCLARFPSRLRRILASEGRLDFTLLCPLSLLLTDDESLSDWTPTEYNTKTMRRTVIDGRQRKIAPALLPGLCFLPPAAKKSNCCWSLMQMLIWSCLGPAHNEGDRLCERWMLRASRLKSKGRTEEKYIVNLLLWWPILPGRPEGCACFISVVSFFVVQLLIWW